ncbi:hypothetical protein NDU88_001365 [Pleurodeles waltl]|uniref:Uncharacterized protein n=1 Tax=Pleurodeles waltl TaxID=8319 RepID=A0AAV7L990_PLEWA|nr:hypothetical protein NDU88_001365 [Pleurodeles waltl]
MAESRTAQREDALRGARRTGVVLRPDRGENPRLDEILRSRVLCASQMASAIKRLEWGSRTAVRAKQRCGRSDPWTACGQRNALGEDGEP